MEKTRGKIRGSAPVVTLLVIVTLVFCFSTIGYMLIEGFSFSDAFYMTVITVSTVGFSEVHPLTGGGRLFTAIVIISSFGLFAYSISSITQYVFDGELQKYLRNYKVNQKLERLRDHVIVCGYGRNGSQAVDELLGLGMTVVIIDGDAALLDSITKTKQLLCVVGDAVQDETLIYARISKAKALITTLPKDADNLFVVLTARELCSHLRIISRASEDHSYSKLKRAGADNVIMPDKVGGIRMAKLIAQPDVVEFIENILLHTPDQVNLEEISCELLPPANLNKTIREFKLRDRSGANIIGLKTGSGEYVFNPSPDFKLSFEDKLFALGTPKQVESLKRVLSDEKSTLQERPQNRFSADSLQDDL